MQYRYRCILYTCTVLYRCWCMRYTVPVLVNSITALHLLAPVKLTPVVYPAGPALAEKIGEFAGSGFLFKVRPTCHAIRLFELIHRFPDACRTCSPLGFCLS